MDLRLHRPSAAQLESAVELVGRGLLCYQPFIFSEEFETGAGLEFGALIAPLRHPWLGIGGEPGQFDVVFSIAVLVQLSDPLEHLAYLGQMARKVLLVWTTTSMPDDDGVLKVEYQASNRYYLEDKFPYCFDVVRISPALLRRSLELMGFTQIHPIANRPGGMPEEWFRKHRGYLAIRPS